MPANEDIKPCSPLNKQSLKDLWATFVETEDVPSIFKTFDEIHRRCKGDFKEIKLQLSKTNYAAKRFWDSLATRGAQAQYSGAPCSVST